MPGKSFYRTRKDCCLFGSGRSVSADKDPVGHSCYSDCRVPARTHGARGYNIPSIDRFRVDLESGADQGDGRRDSPGSFTCRCGPGSFSFVRHSQGSAVRTCRRMLWRGPLSGKGDGCGFRERVTRRAGTIFQRNSSRKAGGHGKAFCRLFQARSRN